MDITNRIDAVSHISDLRIQMGGIQPAPKSVKIEITAKCNLLCKFCALRTRDVPSKNNMDFWFFQRITEDMRINGVEEIGLFYLGESFTEPVLLAKCIEWCKKQLEFPYVFLTSNAVAANADIVDQMMYAGLDSLKWSVNASDPIEYKKMTGGNEKLFKKMVNNIQSSFLMRNKLGHKTMLSASSILYEGEQKNKMDEFLKHRIIPFVDKHYWLPLYQMSMYSDKVKQDTGYTPTQGNMGRIDETTMKPIRKALPCWSAFTEGHVRYDGGLSACCFGADDRFDMGTLDGTNFMRQWNSKKFQALRVAQLKTIDEGQKALSGTPCQVCVVA